MTNCIVLPLGVQSLAWYGTIALAIGINVQSLSFCGCQCIRKKHRLRQFIFLFSDGRLHYLCRQRMVLRRLKHQQKKCPLSIVWNWPCVPKSLVVFLATHRKHTISDRAVNKRFIGLRRGKCSAVCEC